MSSMVSRAFGAGWYVVVRGLSSQRWIPPLAIYPIALVIIVSAGGSALDNGALAALVLVPVSTWLVIVSLNSDDRSQFAVSAVAIGGPGRMRAVTALTAAVGSWALGCAGAGLSVLADPDHGAPDGAAAVLLMVLAANTAAIAVGIAIGSFCSVPIIRSRGTARMTSALLCIAVIGVPGSPPQQLAVAVASSDHPRDPAAIWFPLTICVISGVCLVALAIKIMRNRAH